MSIRSSSGSHVKARLKTDPTEYIFNQEQADCNLQLLLIQIKEWHFQYQMNNDDKIATLATSIEMQCHSIDKKHRSYPEARSLTLTVISLSLVRIHKLPEAQCAIALESDLQQFIQRPEFRAKSVLLQIFYLHASNTPDSSQATNEAIKTQYSLLKRIKLKLRKDSLLYRRWETVTLDQILVYQFQLIIKLIGEYDRSKESYLFGRGLKIANRILGPNHKLTQIIQNVSEIKSSTKKLLKTESSSHKTIVSRRKRKKLTSCESSKNSTSQQFSAFAHSQIHSILSLPKNSAKSPKPRNTSYGESWINKKYFNKPRLVQKEAAEMKELTKITELYQKKSDSPDINSTTERMKSQSMIDSELIVIPQKIIPSEKLRDLNKIKNHHKRAGGFIIHQEPKIYNQKKLEEILRSPPLEDDSGPPKKQSVPAVQHIRTSSSKGPLRTEAFKPVIEDKKWQNTAKQKRTDQNPELGTNRGSEPDDTFCQLI